MEFHSETETANIKAMFSPGLFLIHSFKTIGQFLYTVTNSRKFKYTHRAANKSTMYLSIGDQQHGERYLIENLLIRNIRIDELFLQIT